MTEKKPDPSSTYTIVLTNEQRIVVEGNLTFADGLVIDNVDGKIRFAAPYSSVLYVTSVTGQPRVSTLGEGMPIGVGGEDDDDGESDGDEVPY